MPPLLSILVPTWNRRKELEALLCVLEEQMVGFDDIELLVSNNCSSDSTDELLKRFAAKPRVRIFRQVSNLGPHLHLAWLYGQAEGKFLWLIGDDDLIVPETLKTVREILVSNPNLGWLHLPGLIHVIGREHPLEMLCPPSDVKVPKARALFPEYSHWVGWITGNVMSTKLIQAQLPKLKFSTPWWPWELLMRATAEHPGYVLSKRTTIAGAEMTWKDERNSFLAIEMPRMLLSCDFFTEAEHRRMFENLYHGESINNLPVLLKKEPRLALRILRIAPSLLPAFATSVARLLMRKFSA